MSSIADEAPVRPSIVSDEADQTRREGTVEAPPASGRGGAAVPRRRSLRSKLLLLLITFVTLPLLVLSSWMMVESRSQVRARAVAEQQLITARAQSLFNSSITTIESELLATGRSLHLTSPDPDGRQVVLSSLLGTVSVFESVSVVGADGVELARASRLGSADGAELRDLSQTRSFVAAVDTGQAGLDVRIDTSGRSLPSMVIVVPVVGRASGTTVLAMRAEVGLPALWSAVGADVGGGRKADAAEYLVGPDGTILAHAKPALVLSRVVDPVGGGDGFVTGLEGVDVVAASLDVVIGDNVLRVVTTSSADAAMRPFYRDRQVIVVIVVVGVALAVLASVATGRRITGPLVGLASAAQSFERDHSVRADVTARDEIGVLAASFNRMADEVANRIEELDRLNDALTTSNAELELFASIAAHDLQEPLRKIQSFGDRLARVAGEELDPRGRESLAKMTEASARMRTLIDNLLEYSRVTTAGGRFERVDLEQIVGDVAVDRPDGDDDVTVVVEGSLPVVEADPAQMYRLFMNLVANAAKFRRPDRRPEVRISADGPLRDGWATIVVADNGIGFDPAYSEQIFATFKRLHGRDAYEGSGMGLSICRRIVSRHDGTITATGTEGSGATFMITLPLRQG